MNKVLKGILIVLCAVLLIGAAYLIGRGAGGGAITKQVPFSLTVTAAGDFEMTITPADREVAKGAIAEYAITVVPSGGFDADVQLTVSGLPAGSYEFTRNPLGPGAWSTTLRVNTATLETNSTYSCNLSGHDI